LKILWISLVLMCKRANFWRRKNLPFCPLSSIVRKRLCIAASASFLNVVAASGRTRSFPYFFFVVKTCCEDAVALRLGGGSRKATSKAAHALHCHEASGLASAKGGLAPARPTDEYEIRESASGGRCLISYFLIDQLSPVLKTKTISSLRESVNLSSCNRGWS
jgi:hypothetical protein